MENELGLMTIGKPKEMSSFPRSTTSPSRLVCSVYHRFRPSCVQFSSAMFRTACVLVLLQSFPGNAGNRKDPVNFGRGAKRSSIESSSPGGIESKLDVSGEKHHNLQ